MISVQFRKAIRKSMRVDFRIKRTCFICVNVTYFVPFVLCPSIVRLSSLVRLSSVHPVCGPSRYLGGGLLDSPRPCCRSDAYFCPLRGWRAMRFRCLSSFCDNASNAARSSLARLFSRFTAISFMLNCKAVMAKQSCTEKLSPKVFCNFPTLELTSRSASRPCLQP